MNEMNWYSKSQKMKRKKKLPVVNPYEMRLNAIERLFPDGLPAEQNGDPPLEIATVQPDFFSENDQTGAPSTKITYEDLCRASMCEFCGMTVSKKNRKCHLQTHLIVEMDRPQNEGYRLYRCQICSEFTSYSKKEAMIHMNSHRVKGIVFACQLCGESFEKRHDFDLHTISHHDEVVSRDLPFNCEETEAEQEGQHGSIAPPGFRLQDTDEGSYVLVESCALEEASSSRQTVDDSMGAAKDPNEIQPFELSFEEMTGGNDEENSIEEGNKVFNGNGDDNSQDPLTVTEIITDGNFS